MVMGHPVTPEKYYCFIAESTIKQNVNTSSKNELHKKKKNEYFNLLYPKEYE